jgi:hypothetical protein
VKDLLMENLVERILPQLLQEYQAGKTGIKKILRLTGLSSDELLQRIIKDKIECPITPEIDDYTEKITMVIIQNEREKIAKRK